MLHEYGFHTGIPLSTGGLTSENIKVGRDCLDSSETSCRFWGANNFKTPFQCYLDDMHSMCELAPPTLPSAFMRDRFKYQANNSL